MRIVVTGSRHWVQPDRIEERLRELPRETTVVAHGQAPSGADPQADRAARRLGIPVEPYPVEEALDGPWPAAGHRRNARMLASFEPDLVLAFRAEGKSNGTDGCVAEAERRGIPVEVITEEGG